MIRATQGNLPQIQKKIVCHRKSHGVKSSAGLAMRHRANPLPSIGAEKIFDAPILFSGMCALTFKKSETDILTFNEKQRIEGPLKLQLWNLLFNWYRELCQPEVSLHIKQLTQFGIICYKIVYETLHICMERHKSWFAQIPTHCYMYCLPHPLSLLSRQHPKEENNILF